MKRCAARVLATAGAYVIPGAGCGSESRHRSGFSFPYLDLSLKPNWIFRFLGVSSIELGVYQTLSIGEQGGIASKKASWYLFDWISICTAGEDWHLSAELDCSGAEAVHGAWRVQTLAKLGILVWVSMKAPFL